MPISRNEGRIPIKPLSGGVRSDRSANLIQDGESPNAKNVEFSNESVRAARGSRKMGNQVAPSPAIRCRPDPAYSPLYVEAGKSVPLRGSIFWGYDALTDLGGDGVASGTFPNETFHNRRGRSFELQVSFRLPEDFRMMERPARGEGAPTSGNAAIEAGCGYDEGLEDCTIIMQKGGDRTVPMSWALGIVNAGNHAYTAGITAKARKSNYFLVFMWLDAPGWGNNDRTAMRYSLSTFANNSTGSYPTMALRAVILDGRDDANFAYALEPGREYSVSLGVSLDTLPSGVYGHNGRVDFSCQERNGPLMHGDFVDSVGGGTTTNLTVWKGPTDSLRYLAKFGIRYTGADAVHFGLGYRTAPWNAQGFIPYGMDSAAMEHKGFRMADCSLNSVDDLYGTGAYTLTCTHPVAGNTYFSLNSHRGLTEPGPLSTGSWTQTPLGLRGAAWNGYGGVIDDSGAPSSAFNSEALRGYRIVFPRSADGAMNALRGGAMTIESYSEVGVNDYRLEVQDAESLGVTWAGEQPFLLRAFRWNQQAIDIQECRIWSSIRDYTNARVLWSMTNALRLDDETEPELSKLQAYLPFNDGEGRSCRELVRGKDAYFSPCSLALSKQGQQGENMLFLSGEGDALVLDLSENPVFAREMRELLQSNARGFAIEFSCILPEAHYGVATTTNPGPRNAEYEAAYCPDLATWAVKGADESGTLAAAQPLLVFGHHSWWALERSTPPERRAQGFHLDIYQGLDGENRAPVTAVGGITRSDLGAGNWDDTTPWVGKRITIQLGVQPSPANRAGTAGFLNEYRVYIAASPKGLFKYAQGENPEAEFAYYADFTIQKKDLPRLVAVIGGGWNPGAARGYTEYSARMILDDVRVYGATAAGELPSSSGLVTPDRRGKILGENSLPQRKLTASDLLAPLGAGTRTANLTEGSVTVLAPGGTAFFTDLPESTRDSVREKYLVPLADVYPLPSLDEVTEFIQEFYFAPSVAAGGASLTLATPYNGPSSARAGAGALNLIGYTTFDGALDDILRNPLSLGSGSAYKPGTTRTKDLVLSPGLFENESPIDALPGGGFRASWKVRIASPFTEGGLATVLPQWVRGIVSPRRGEITGIHGQDTTVYATCQGAIHKVDDRWREDGPTDTLRNSFAFLGKQVGRLEHRFPRAFDAIRFANYTNAWPYWLAALYRDFTWVYDFWVWLDEYAEIETLAWLGCEQSHMLGGPGATNELRGIGLWPRLVDGRPELVRESAGNFTGGSAPPPMGRYTATSADRIPLRRWTHVRFWLEHYQTGGVDILRIPGISIMGRRTRVVANAVETGLVGSSDWIRASNGGGLVGTQGDTRNALYLGVARDVVSMRAKTRFTALNQLGGQEFPGTKIVGRMHPLLGRMADACCWRASSVDASVAGFPDFDPYTLSYTGKAVRWRADLQEGVGHKVHDGATEFETGFNPTVPGLVHSHPFLDLWNEFGVSLQRPSMLSVERRTYMANGGRPAFVTEDGGGVAGIIAPTTAPRFRVERKPLWEPNFAPSGSTSPEQDPIAQAAVGAGAQIHHYSNYGNNCLRQRFHEAMRWTKDDAGSGTPFDIFGLKFYWHPREVAGRIPLWSARGSMNSGGLFIECVDGKARLGWYDTALKKQVWVESNVPVFRAGYWYYVRVRKGFPLQDTTEGNWRNSFWAESLRRRAAFTPGVGTFAVGDMIRNAGSTKRGLVTKVESTFIEYIRWAIDAEFTAAEAVQNAGATATGTIAATPFQTTGDIFDVIEMPKTSVLRDQSPWSANTLPRTGLSMTCGMPRVAGTTGVGQVTPKGAQYVGAASGVIDLNLAVHNIGVFRASMVGRFFQFANTTTPEKLYRIRTVNSSIKITVEDEFGNLPNLTAFTTREGAVFAGVELVKSPDFDLSKVPDSANYDIEFMGSKLAADPANGLARMNGKFASFAWHVVSSQITNTAFYSGFSLFESTPGTLDMTEWGADTLPFTIFSASGRPGELHVDAACTFACVDTQPYSGPTPAASTQPNSALKVDQDAEASTSAEALYWQHLVEEEKGWGRRLVQVIFYDADQDVRSNPGPQLVIEPGTEDESNPSGLTRLLLDDLPISHQRGNIQRWIYVTEATQPILYRQTIVPDNISASAALELDDGNLDFSQELDYDNPAPPNCSVLGYSQSSMWFGDVEVGGVRMADAAFFSKAVEVMNVPFTQLVPLVGGRGGRITAMANLGGQLLVWKRGSLHAVRIVDTPNGPAGAVTDLSSNVGAPCAQALAVLDGVVYWLSTDRGFYVYAGGAEPLWLGEAISDIFEGRGTSALFNADGRYIDRVSVAVNRLQDQVVGVLRAAEERDQRRRVSLEFDGGLSGAGVSDPNGFRHALYEGPNLTALGAAQRLGGGAHRFLGGTAEGFVAELDREDTQLELAGASAELSNPTTVTLGPASSTTRLTLAAPPISYLADLEGIRGMTLSWMEGAVEKRAVALFSDGFSIHLDRALASAPPNGTVVAIGAIPLLWTLKWADLGASEMEKRHSFLDFVIVKQASGEAIMEVFADFETTPAEINVDGVVTTAYTVDLTKPTHRVELREVNSKFIQVRFRTLPTAAGAGARLEVTEMVLRTMAAGQHS